MGYHTKQKSAVLDCLARHRNESLTVDGVVAALCAEGVKTGRSTVYRHLEALRDEAYRIAGKPDSVEFEDEVVAVVESRDGSILDVIRKIRD